MMQKSFSFLLIVSLFLISTNFVLAQTSNNWTAVENAVNQEVTIKTTNGRLYGILKSVSADNLVLQIAGNKTLSQEERTVSRSDIRQIHRALLFVNDRNIGKGTLIGAAIGAGAGAAIGGAALGSTGGSDEAGLILGVSILLGAASGVVGGAVGGFFWKTKHKKRDLIYKR